jgi:hypothetical protein
VRRQLETNPRADGLLHYGWHFGLLAAVAAVLATTSPWRPMLGMVGWFGIYGALHSSMVAVTWRGRLSPMRRLLFIGMATALSMLSGLAALYASRRGWWWGAGPVVPLVLCSSLGAATYGALLRWFGAQLPLRALATLPLGCVLATLAVLGSGVYRYGGTGCFAAAWWFAWSLGLWFEDERRLTAEF